MCIWLWCEAKDCPWLSNTTLTYLLTYSMVQSPSWEANWFAASQDIPHISWNPKVHYCTHKRPPPVPILGQPNPVHIPTSHLLEIHPNISLRFPHQDPIRPPLLTHTRHMPSPSHSSRFYHPHNIGWGIQIIQLFVSRRQLEIAFYVFMLKICISVLSIKFHGNRSSESCAVICGQTDMTKLRGAFHDYSNASESMRAAVSAGLASLWTLQASSNRLTKSHSLFMSVLFGLMAMKYTVSYCKRPGRNKWQ